MASDGMSLTGLYHDPATGERGQVHMQKVAIRLCHYAARPLQ